MQCVIIQSKSKNLNTDLILFLLISVSNVVLFNEPIKLNEYLSVFNEYLHSLNYFMFFQLQKTHSNVVNLLVKHLVA